jgi:signal transduction histidine kinase
MPPQALRVLILEDQPADADLVIHELKRAGFAPQWRRVDTERDFDAQLDPSLDIILADYNLPGFDAIRALRLVQRRGIDVPFVVVSGAVGDEAAVECIKEGANDYLLKDRLARLGQAVRAALEQRRLRLEKERAEVERARLLASEQEARARAEILSRRVVDLQEEERRRLARELHDELGALLTGLKLLLQAPARAGREPGRDSQMLGLVDELLGRVRDLSMNLGPPMLEDLGLLPALLWYFERCESQAGLHVDFEHAGIDRRFDRKIEIAAYRIVQEALTNVARHVGKVVVKVVARADAARLSLRMEDPGPGFDVEAALAGRSSGLSGMRERARLLGGRFTVTSSRQGGTRFEVELPLDARGETP